MKRSGWFVPLLLAGLVAFADAQPAKRKAAPAAPPTKYGLPWLKLRASAGPLKPRLDQMGLKVSTPISMVPRVPPQEAAATVTLGAQTTSAVGACAFGGDVEFWAGGALSLEGIEPGIWFREGGDFYILYSLTGTQGKDLIFECSGAFASAMGVD